MRKGIFILFIISLLVGCSPRISKKEYDKVVKENEILKEELNNYQLNSDNYYKKTPNDNNIKYSVEWADGEGIFKFGGSTSYAEVVDAYINKSEYDDLLFTIDFKYTNNSEDACNLMNDDACYIELFQNGVELEYYTWDGKRIKDGACVDSSISWMIDDFTSPIEIGFGYPNKVTKTINIIELN